ncbi:hypothetical protein [Abyssibacter sp.]|jgi:hypothetical protein|uniref:hypothetical protein n=1 Tax=Abyssibacter sp. TaxID=2320200 RepID=UPI000C42525C|nr:hypothetical protein [Abyssibacter sp.]MBB87921.1 hypothetical protein [Xanthomonadales bacterium]MCK5857720.1 hypothetical protein [Abyssibacter sp.]
MPRTLFHRTTLTLVFGGALLVTGCEGGEDSGTVGACVNLANDEVLHIDDASGTTTDATIGEIVLSGFAIDGDAISAESIAAGRSTNITLDGNALNCVLPCSFGTEPGTWTFGASADGYELTPQEVEAEYNRFVGGCPSYDEDGTHVSITLDESGV